LTRLVQAYDALAQAAGYANAAGMGDGVSSLANPWFTYHNCNGWFLGTGIVDGLSHSAIAPPVPNWLNWDGSETIVQFLNRIDAEATWYYPTPLDPACGYAIRQAYAGSTAIGFFKCLVPDWLLPYVSGRAFDNSRRSRIAPPVWPGIALATLSTPVALAVGVTITEPMHGLLIDITATPAHIGGYDYDGVMLHSNIGRAAFIGDTGYAEWPQAFGWPASVLCPRTMMIAESVRIACKTGVEGTATPWVYTL
jgi:hypothetical protein